MKEPIITHDDCLRLRALKHKAGMVEDWKWKAPRNLLKITSYWNTRTNERHSSDFDPPDNDPDWKPCYEREYRINEDSRIIARESYLELHILNLWDNFQSRYRTALDAFIDSASDLFEYNPTKPAEELTPKNVTEAFRWRLRNQWKVAEYEHNLIFRGELAKIYREELNAIPSTLYQHSERNTRYFEGYNEPKKTKLKAYRMEKHGLPNCVKIEVTLRGYHLQRTGLRDINQYRKQPEIQTKVAEILRQKWTTALKYTPRTKRAIRELTGTEDFMRELLNPEHTFTAVIQRLDRLEIEQLEIKQRVERLENHMPIHNPDNDTDLDHKKYQNLKELELKDK